jgi:hypothetical protein
MFTVGNVNRDLIIKILIRFGPLARFCVTDDEFSGSIKAQNFLAFFRKTAHKRPMQLLTNLLIMPASTTISDTGLVFTVELLTVMLI